MSKLTFIKEASHYFDDLTDVILPLYFSAKTFRHDYPYADIIGFLMLAGILFVIFEKYLENRKKKQAKE